MLPTASFTDAGLMRILITGSAGFIGFHLARRLLADGHTVIGLDALTPYYDVALKAARHAILAAEPRFAAVEATLEEPEAIGRAAGGAAVDALIHLAAQAGVRYSLQNPRAYVDSNLVGTFNVMEFARSASVPHFMLASTSSVYGANPAVPFRETDPVDHPLSLYAATKRSTEVMAHAYSHLWQVPTTAFRFFTAYGPWGRPDMAPHRFTKGVIAGTPIDLYNGGRMARDFTYIDDLVEGIVRLIACTPPHPEARAAAVPGDSLSPVAPFRVVNIGTGRPCALTDFVAAIEQAVGRPAIRNLMPMQPGDVRETFASADLLTALTGFRPNTPLSDGVAAFVAWYREYYHV
jgi:UDP-glucuronate 4-epimerase